MVKICYPLVTKCGNGTSTIYSGFPSYKAPLTSGIFHLAMFDTGGHSQSKHDQFIGRAHPSLAKLSVVPGRFFKNLSHLEIRSLWGEVWLDLAMLLASCKLTVAEHFCREPWAFHIFLCA